jgi:hypothetical protein
MTRLLARAVGCAIFGALAGAAAMILLSGLDSRFTLEMTQDRPGLLRGFYPGERDGDLTFAWTAARAEMPLVGLDRNVSWTARIRVRGGRRDPATLPTLTVLADDVPVAARQTTNEFETFDATIPAKTGHVRGLTLALAVSNTFVPGAADGRALGVQIDRISVAPSTLGAFPPRRTVAAAALGSAVFGAIFGLLAATATTAVGAATLLAVGQAAVLRIGLGPFAPWLTRVELLAASIGIALLLIAVGVERWRHERLRHTARFALMFTGSVLYLHLLVLLHPDKPLAETVGHVLQLSLLANGAFSYPFALYAAALPFVHAVADPASLLWTLAAVAEAISFLFFYWMIVRGTGDRVMAAVAVAVAQLMPGGFDLMADAHLTAVFGQAVVVITVSCATAALLDRRPWQFWATGVAVIVAFLSDAGSVATAGTTLVASALLVTVFGRRDGRRLGSAPAIVLGLAAFGGVVFSPATFGWPFFVLAILGAAINLFAGRLDDWWLLVWAWLLASSGVILWDVLRAGTIHHYGAIPPVAVFAASGIVTLWNAGGRRRVLAVASSALGAALGVIGWLSVLGPALE